MTKLVITVYLVGAAITSAVFGLIARNSSLDRDWWLRRNRDVVFAGVLLWPMVVAFHVFYAAVMWPYWLTNAVLDAIAKAKEAARYRRNLKEFKERRDARRAARARLQTSKGGASHED